jgi:hypothetical protein
LAEATLEQIHLSFSFQRIFVVSQKIGAGHIAEDFAARG